MERVLLYIDFCKQHKLCGHFFSFFEEQNLRKEKVVMRLLGTQNRSIFVGGFLKIDSGRKQDILSNLGNANSIWLVNVKIGWTTPFCGKKRDLIFSYVFKFAKWSRNIEMPKTHQLTKLSHLLVKELVHLFCFESAQLLPKQIFLFLSDLAAFFDKG